MSLPPSSPTPDRREAEMGFVMELCTVVAGTSELQPILDWMVQKTTALLGADECSIKLLSSDLATAHTVIVDHRKTGPEAGTASWPGPLKASVMGFLLVQHGELATSDINADPRFPGLRSLQTNVKAILAVPMLVDGKTTGMIAVSEHKAGRVWTPSDIQLLNIVSSQSAGVLEKARLRAEAEAKRRLEQEKEKMEKELLLARDIQMKLVPETALHAGPWHVEGRVVPAKEIGGDYCDYFTLGPERFGVVIADVSGKGIPAALLVSTVSGTVRAFADGRRSPSEVVVEVNRAVVRTAAAGKFCTLFYGEIDHARGTLTYVNAGHNYPLLRRASGTTEMLKTGGVPLGLFDQTDYPQSEIPFVAGDSLLLFSDGITEAIDLFREEFGDERLEKLWAEHARDTPHAMIDRVMDAVIAFRGAAAQSDDMTTVVLGARTES